MTLRYGGRARQSSSAEKDFLTARFAVEMLVVQAVVFSPWIKPRTRRCFIAPALIVLAVGLFLVPRASDFALMLAVVGILRDDASAPQSLQDPGGINSVLRKFRLHQA